MKPFKTCLCLALAAAFVFCAAACGDGGNEKENPVTVIEEGYSRLDVKQSNGRKTEGFGTQFDTCIVEKQNGLNDADWKVQIDALEKMQLQSVRIRFYPEMYERGNDNNDPESFDYDSPNVDFDSIEMNYLYKLLDVFEKNGVKVDLSWYGCRTTFQSEDGKINGSWLGGTFGQDGILGWMNAPVLTDHPDEEFAESVAACLNYLINTKKYTCLYEYSLFPEPEGVIHDMAKYKRICEKVTANLQKYGIADKILFSGPADYNNNTETYENKYLSYIDYQKATSSVYAFKNESSDAEMLAFAEAYAAVCDKYGLSWGIAESGTSNFLTAVTNSDSDTYERALFMARFLINMVNGGCTNIKYFVFSDCYYDGNLNELGLFRFKHEDWKAKPVWYSWSLITRYTEFGSDIFPIGSDVEGVCATAFKLPDGSWTYLLANSSKKTQKVAIVNEREDRPETLAQYRMTGSSLPEDGALELIAKTGDVSAKNRAVHVTLAPNSFVVLSDKQ